MEDDKAYAEGYKAGWEDHKDEVRDQTKKYALALLALNGIYAIIQEFVKEALPKSRP